MTEPTINIPPAEFQARAARLLEHIQAQQLSGAVLFHQTNVLDKLDADSRLDLFRLFFSPE